KVSHSASRAPSSRLVRFISVPALRAALKLSIDGRLAIPVRKPTFSCHDEEVFLAGYDFTTRVRGALIKARDEAHRRNHEYVGTQHLLLGLLAEDDALVMDVFDNLGVRPIDIQTTVAGYLTDGPAPTRSRIHDLPYTPRARVVLDQAI